MSKAARIRELYSQGLKTREIADLVGCRIEYVRVCARQRRDGRPAPADLNWLKKNGFRNNNDAQAHRLGERWNMEPRAALAKYHRELYWRQKVSA